ncbi:hypothetical protein QBC44DRAFT_368015 [Cladorrhinum sp. PSN332]|nr:hypothetical protein QBC44DRAFT_368015 [Cladorrhinum sp. PSN332]
MGSDSVSAGTEAGPSNAPIPHPIPPERLRYTFQHASFAGQQDSIEGWPLLANLMTVKPDYEAFGLFRNLHIKNLLYYQVELSSLGQDLARLEQTDWWLAPETAENHEDQFHMIADMMIDSDTDQWELVVKLRKVLREYDDALIRYAKVSALPKPSSRSMSTLLKWLVAPMAGNFKIRGRGSEVWGKQYERTTQTSLKQQIPELVFNLCNMNKSSTRDDLIAPQEKKSVDGITLWLQEVVYILSTIYTTFTDRRAERHFEHSDVEMGQQRSVPPRTAPNRERLEETELRDLKLDYIAAPTYPGQSLFPLISKSVTFTACMLPIVAVAALLDVETLPRQIALIAGFTALFAFGLMMLTGITRAQIFTATCAFLAVLVVFVGTPGP